MNSEERVVFHKSSEDYFSKNQIRDLFEQMTTEAVLDLPADPLQYFIDFLKTRQLKKLVCIVGQNDVINSQIITMVSRDFQYQELTLNETFDQSINGQPGAAYDNIKEQMKKCDPDSKGFIIKNFPSNINQALW